MIPRNIVSILVLIAVSLLAIGGCRKEPQRSEGTTVNASEQAEAAGSVQEKPQIAQQGDLVAPLLGIGDVRFGMSKDEVIKHLGRPNKEYPTAETTKLDYVATRGLGLTIHAERGLQMIQCRSDSWPQKLPFPVTTFAGRTKEGIGMGATRGQIIDAYGLPDRTSSSSDPQKAFENLYYDKLRIKLTLWQDKLISITLEAPAP
jgi:hypothetical protein